MSCTYQGGYIGDYVGEYPRGYPGGYWELRICISGLSLLDTSYY